MKTLEADVEISADGSLKLLSPLPAWLKPGRAHVRLTVDTHQNGTKPRRERVAATPEMLAQRKAALDDLRAMGGLRNAIPDPVEWQKEMREDVVLPGRD